MSILYDLGYAVLFILYIPILLLKGKLHRGYCVRLGAIPKTISERLSNKQNLWLHAVSVGEVLAIVDLIKRIKREYPEYQIVLTTVTKTGYTLACQNFKDDVVFGDDLNRFVELINV